MPWGKYELLDSDRKQIGERLKAARVNAKMTRNQAAQAVGLFAHTSLWHYETGRSCPSLPVFHRLCKVYKVSMDNVLRGIGL